MQKIYVHSWDNREDYLLLELRSFNKQLNFTERISYPDLKYLPNLNDSLF